VPDTNAKLPEQEDLQMNVPPINLLGISGSLRAQSYNSAALRAVASVLADGMTFKTASLSDLPFYNADVEQRGFPDEVVNFRRDVAAADALVFAIPEYNFSVSGVLKNALEWLSRPPDPPANGKPCAMFGASVSPLGTARGQFHFRHICVSLNMIPVNVPHVDIASAKTKFDAQGRLIDQAAVDQLRELVGALGNLTVRLGEGRGR
jgi:chromate reductase, NAD(P)H dehydrogenase (quinone)